MASQSSAHASLEQNKDLVRACYQTVWNRRRTDRVADYLSPGVVIHSPGAAGLQGIEAYRQFTEKFLAAVPDYRIEFHETLAESDLVAFRWTCSGTHNGELFTLKATGKKFTLTGITIMRVRDGRIVEGWAERDVHGLVARLTKG